MDQDTKLKRDFFDFMKEKEHKKGGGEEKEQIESPIQKKMTEVPVKQFHFATPGTPNNPMMHQQKNPPMSPSTYSPSHRSFVHMPPMVEGPCSVMLDAVNALQHAANSQLIKVAFCQQSSIPKSHIEEKLVLFCTQLTLPAAQVNSILNLAQLLAGRIAQRWPVTLSVVMVGSFSMNTPSINKPIVDLLLIPADIALNDGIKTDVPAPSDILAHLFETKQPSMSNVKIEYIEPERPNIQIKICGLDEDARFERSIDFDKDKLQLVVQTEHPDCIEFLFFDPAYPEARARLFVPTQTSPSFFSKKMTRFQAGAHHSTWVRLISGEEIQIGVMHTLILLRHLR